jgi:hypothetical protein
MKRFLIVAAAVFAGVLPAALLSAAPSTGKATTTKTTSTTTTSTTTIGGTNLVGATKTPVAPPVCPKGVAAGSCNIVLTRATALETIRDSVTYPTTVKTAGTIVAFTVGVAKLSTSVSQTQTYIHDLDTSYDGVTQIQLTILKPGKGTAGNKIWTVAAESTSYHLQPYLGYTVEFPLATPIRVTPGETVALTTPTWAPVLSYDLPLSKFAYRQSRKSNCPHVGKYQNAQLKIGQATNYKCDYAGTRVEYDATEILNAPAPKNYVH